MFRVVLQGLRVGSCQGVTSSHLFICMRAQQALSDSGMGRGSEHLCLWCQLFRNPTSAGHPSPSWIEETPRLVPEHASSKVMCRKYYVRCPCRNCFLRYVGCAHGDTETHRDTQRHTQSLSLYISLSLCLSPILPVSLTLSACDSRPRTRILQDADPGVGLVPGLAVCCGSKTNNGHSNSRETTHRIRVIFACPVDHHRSVIEALSLSPFSDCCIFLWLMPPRLAINSCDALQRAA